MSGPAQQRSTDNRRDMLAGKLDVLLASMNRLKKTTKGRDPIVVRQLREGAELAVKLADLIAREQSLTTLR